MESRWQSLVGRPVLVTGGIFEGSRGVIASVSEEHGTPLQIYVRRTTGFGHGPMVVTLSEIKFID